ncbi:MAG: hypothetical protein FJ116_06155 [Deltaproteobacteria bacterium]|nr:hypothetical protein [Deltaproteobacteria bacterium]
MKNKLYSILVCCLVLGFGSVGRTEDDAAPEVLLPLLSCTEICASTPKTCEAGDDVANATCDGQESGCFEKCNEEALKKAKAEQKANLKVCLKAAHDKKLSATKACRTAFNNTPATVGTCTADRIKAREVKIKCLRTARGTYRDDIKACYR